MCVGNMSSNSTIDNDVFQKSNDEGLDDTTIIIIVVVIVVCGGGAGVGGAGVGIGMYKKRQKSR